MEDRHMLKINQRLARRTGPILLTVGLLLAVGAVVTTLGHPLIGWPVYGFGYVGSLVGFPVVAMARRAPLGRLAATGLAILMTGIVIGLPVMVMMLGFYAQSAPLHDLLMPYAMSPVGMVAGPLAWMGLAVFGVSIIRDRALPLAAGVLFALAPVLALPAEAGLLPEPAWAAAFVLVASALILIASGGVRLAAPAVAS
jgi:hypothetical protein